MRIYSPEQLHHKLNQSTQEILAWNKQKKIFYSRYPAELANSAEATTIYPHSDIKSADNPKNKLLQHTSHMTKPTIALVGAGNFRPQTPEYRFAQAVKPGRIVTIEPYTNPEGPQLTFTNYSLDISRPLPKNLLNFADIVTFFYSVIMDLAPGALIATFLNLSFLLKENGIVAFDLNLNYQREAKEYHVRHPNSPIGIFKRQWDSKNAHRPIVGTFMRLDQQLLYSLSIHSGLRHLADYTLTTTSISKDKRTHHPRLTSIWQKVGNLNPRLFATVK